MTFQTPPILPDDPMSEAGRKIFAHQFSRMQAHQPGSRHGQNIESVHQMRVAIRRMRSLFKLIKAHYEPGTVKKYSRKLRKTARLLGFIRDLDVLMLDLRTFRQAQPPTDQRRWDDLLQTLDGDRHAYRQRLNDWFDRPAYQRFIVRFQQFSTQPGNGAAPVTPPWTPHQVRHVLPLLLHQRLAQVKAYQTVLPEASDPTLHALRVECKQLRYALEFFQPALGTTAAPFIVEVKAMQDMLGRMNDIAVFTQTARQLQDRQPEQADIIESYLMERRRELGSQRGRFMAQWRFFHQRKTRRQFAYALLVLR